MSSANLAELIGKKQQLFQTIAKKENKTIVNHKGYKCAVNEVDVLVSEASGLGLIASHMKPWHCKAAYLIGRQAYAKCTSLAKEGRSPAKLFTYLINLELKKSPGQK